MKHILKKKMLAGAGGKEKPKPKPTVLRPPDLGRFELASSYSIVDIVDLISDGPIAGLVNQNGCDVTNGAMLQAVYLDNTPIEISNDRTASQGLSNKAAEKTYLYSIDRTSFNRRFSLFANRMEGVRRGVFRDYDLTNCFFSYEAGGAFDKRRRFAAITFPWLQHKGPAGSNEVKVAFHQGDELGEWQPVFADFFGDKSVPEHFNNGKIISDNLEDYDKYTAYYNQDVSMAKHHYYIKNKSGTVNGSYFSNPTQYAWPNQKRGGSEIEVHYMRNSLSSSASILRELALTVDDNSGSPIYVAQKRKMKAELDELFTNYPLGTNDEHVNKFETDSALKTVTYRDSKGRKRTKTVKVVVSPSKDGPAKFSNSSYPNNGRPTESCFIVIKIGDGRYEGISQFTIGTPGTDANNSVFTADGLDIDQFSVMIPNLLEGITIHSYVIPLTKDWDRPDGSSSIMNGHFYGAIILEIPLVQQRTSGYLGNSRGGDGKTGRWNAAHTTNFNSWKIARWFFDVEVKKLMNPNYSLLFARGGGSSNNYKIADKRYNFSNILCEFKNGDEFQSSLDSFNRIFIDYDYGVSLYGAHRKSRTSFIRRLQEDAGVKGDWDEMNNEQTGGRIKLSSDKGDKEGSSDLRNKVNFSDWQKEAFFNEEATPFIHVIENPNVTSVYFTLGISSLRDTIHKTQGSNGVLTAGDAIPAILVILVEWGIAENGIETINGSQRYSIIAQIESQLLVDFGQPLGDNKDGGEYDYVLLGATPDANRGGPHAIPYNFAKIVDEVKNVSTIKRFIRVTKVSVETNSVLISRECSVMKVTEIIDTNLSYPFSAINGIKLDSRSFSSVPDRSYDCRLKMIKIPKNYQILSSNSKDVRYIQSAEQYIQKRQIYIGDWDGTFVDGWTDNPAWILYDLLTSYRYGLGSYIDKSQINIWELYKIARFCDNVDEEGFYIGVSDGIGGLEPRYSCNILFKENIKVFDAINIVSNLFRGATFFSNSEIHFLDDRPRTPIALFSNSNVKDGFFSYTNNRKDQQFNTVEVVYLDRFDNFKTKVEFVEDESSLRKRGVLKTTINTMGVTSRAMARRIGKHIIHQTINENQSVEFRAGLESLLCRPGDLIIVEDEMKTRETNYGRVLDVNLNQSSLYIENKYSSENYSGKLIVYTPTGYTTMLELENLAEYARYRTDYFDLTGNILSPPINEITGRYSFYKYQNQSTGEVISYSAIYTGTNYPSNQLTFCYYNTGVSGWVFSTGKSFSNNNLYDKMISNTGVFKIQDIDGTGGFNQTGFKYDTAVSDKRGSISGDISNNLQFTTFNSEGGIVENEISTINYPQITTFNVTGFENKEYGANLYLNTLDPNINLLQFVKAGSPYRIERSGASDQIYKISSIREENQNEYHLVATKYDTGKYELIENFIAQDYLPDTYYAGAIEANNYLINQLDLPIIDKFETGISTSESFSLSGIWKKVESATGYEVSVFNSLAQYYSETIVPQDTLKVNFPDLNTLGLWTLNVKALGISEDLDSDFATADLFVLYNGITLFDRPAITKFTIL